MSIVVFGADYLGGIEKNLYACGVTKLVHACCPPGRREKLACDFSAQGC